MKPGMSLIAFDGSGLEFHGTILELGKKGGLISISESHDPGTESALETTLGIGISRGERMDYAIQKSTELGVRIIQPLFTEHCEVKLDDKRAEKRRAHWQQISISACEQSGRVVPPEICSPLPLTHWLEGVSSAYKFLLDQDQQGVLKDISKPESVALLIGPEGGLSDNEKALAFGKGFLGLSLGPRTLRTETAPVAALSVFQHLWGS
jgi:16S rRNA (uracil1498-N3)-methyltransferase